MASLNPFLSAPELALRDEQGPRFVANQDTGLSGTVESLAGCASFVVTVELQEEVGPNGSSSSAWARCWVRSMTRTSAACRRGCRILSDQKRLRRQLPGRDVGGRVGSLLVLDGSANAGTLRLGNFQSIGLPEKPGMTIRSLSKPRLFATCPSTDVAADIATSTPSWSSIRPSSTCSTRGSNTAFRVLSIPPLRG